MALKFSEKCVLDGLVGFLLAMRPAAKVRMAIVGLSVACQCHTDAEIRYDVACGKLLTREREQVGALSSTGYRGAGGRPAVCTFAAVNTAAC